jgi:hypothetical protein
MVIKLIIPMSCAKVSGLLYAVMGLLIGACFSLVFTILGTLIPQEEAPMSGMLGMLFGAGAIVILPIFYGILGFIGGAIVALAYNVIAGWTGGLELDVQ